MVDSLAHEAERAVDCTLLAHMSQMMVEKA
jgi:hypothetical protein